MRLEDRVVIVTGGARGIGAGVAECLAAEGARIGVLDIDGEEAERTAKTLPTDSLGLAADVSDEETAGAAISRAAEHFGRLDGLVNNAGGGNRKTALANGPPFTRVQQEGWDEQMTLNLRTTFAASKAAIPFLTQDGGGAIVNVSSIAGITASPGMPAYAAAKAAVLSLTRSLALELGPSDVRVNAICPGFLYTRAWEVIAKGMQKGIPRYKDMTPRDVFLDVVKRQTPLGREQTPEDVGKLTAFLVSDDSRNITGQIIALDGGITLKGG
jgi:NAD(P)-dependent dehydrogenase (short-subunit alcohol dehydrogenase family)